MMKNRRLPLALAVAALGLCVQGARAADIVPYKAGDKVADFALKDMTGKTVHLSQFKGKVVVINFYGFT